MAWQDKTLKGKYTAPSGKEIPFLWETTERETALKTGIFTFPDRDSAHVQHQGAGGSRRWCLTCMTGRSFAGPQDPPHHDPHSPRGLCPPQGPGGSAVACPPGRAVGRPQVSQGAAGRLPDGSAEHEMSRETAGTTPVRNRFSQRCSGSWKPWRASIRQRRSDNPCFCILRHRIIGFACLRRLTIRRLMSLTQSGSLTAVHLTGQSPP